MSYDKPAARPPALQLLRRMGALLAVQEIEQRGARQAAFHLEGGLDL